MRIAVIENEFGEVGIDDLLISKDSKNYEKSDEEVIELMNGCVCCTVRGDLIKVVKKIMSNNSKKKPFDAIIIETTGMADPAPVAQTFFVDEEVSELVRLDAIITVVDAKHIVQHLDDVRPEGVENESVEQVAFADKILLNKTDLVGKGELEIIKTRLKAINSFAEILESVQSKIDPKKLLNIDGFSLERVLQKEPSFLENTDHMHDLSIGSVSFEVEFSLNLAYLNDFIGKLIRQKSNDLFRYKGVISVVGMDRKFVFQGVHMIFNGDFTTPWGKKEKRLSRFVFIGRNLDKKELTEMFMNCKADPNLRFKIGEEVEARTEPTVYSKGIVIATWDNGNPYRIKLENGDEVWAPDDRDVFVRRRISALDAISPSSIFPEKK